MSSLVSQGLFILLTLLLLWQISVSFNGAYNKRNKNEGTDDILSRSFIGRKGNSFIAEKFKNTNQKPVVNYLLETRSSLGNEFISNTGDVQLCPLISPMLLGAIIINLKPEKWNEHSRNFKMWYGDVSAGGQYTPTKCVARHKIAIIIPYRDRQNHLDILLHHLHPILQRQQVSYRIFVIEQTSKGEFNRAALLNIGFKEAVATEGSHRKSTYVYSSPNKFDCFVFHDVDLLPEDDRIIYSCLENQVKHLAVAVSKWKYRLIYDTYLGGVTALSRSQVLNIDGFANNFYGWGGEDDNLYQRVSDRNYTIFRYPGHISKYKMLYHNKVKMNDKLDDMMSKSKSHQLNHGGLSNLRYVKMEEKMFSLYTWILVELPPEDEV